MPADNNIEGKQLLDLFYKLIKEQTLLKVSLPKTDFESLSVLVDLKVDSEYGHLIEIDMPEGLISVMRPPYNTNRLNFEFTGEDHLTHHFEAVVKQSIEKSIWLTLPTVVKRFQMRNNFRIKVHEDSYATLASETSPIRMEIDNLSVGGVYCFCANMHKSTFKVDSKLEHMALNITTRRDCFMVHVDQVIVKRIESWMRPKHFGVAFEFSQIQKSIRQQLIRHIYDLQRDFLQGRLKLDE